MKALNIAYYVTPHGLGHATRALEVIRVGPPPNVSGSTMRMLLAIFSAPDVAAYAHTSPCSSPMMHFRC